MTDENIALPPERPVTVVVSHLPERGARPLFKDSSRLLALAAFLFSVATGLFASYQTWKNSTEATIENVSKLIDQYYDGQEKFAHLNSTQLDYINLLQSKLRGTALRAVSEATRVQERIDEGTWLALAQINDNENNLSASKIAWTAAVEATKDIRIYMFGLRGLAANQIRQSDNKGAGETLNLAIETVFAEKFKGVANPYEAYTRNIEAATIHAFWLSKTQIKDCGFISVHFDKALTLVAEAYRTANPTDWGYQNALLWIRPVLRSVRKTRESCAPDVNVELLAADDCYAIADIAGNSPVGFGVYRGTPTTPGKADSKVRSRYSLPEAEGCFVDSDYTFYCRWPERGETETKIRTGQIVEKLLACKNLGQVIKSESFTEDASSATQTTTMSLPHRANINIVRTRLKPTDRRSEDWVATLEISPQTSQ